MNIRLFYLGWLLSIPLLIASGCSGDKPQKANSNVLLTLLTPEESGIDFNNLLEEDETNNIFRYDYFYNGAGVAVGDVNNDGLQDLYFTGNLVKNRLYLNKGDLKFEDITETAGVDGAGGWSNGVTMVDINQDGLKDIYVSRSYHKDPTLRKNLLYINNGDLTFTNKAADFGLTSSHFSTQGLFFDFDKDGDLDLYQGNHPTEFFLGNTKEYEKYQAKLPEESDRFYRNDDGKFTDISEEAGIVNYGFTLGLAVGDLNRDGWPDVYVACDYEEPDFYYVNNRDGTFSEQLNGSFRHTAHFAMGVDINDFNDDGYPDIVNVDMVAEDNYREKTMMASMNPPKFWGIVDKGWNYQYMRNMLQLNNGNGTFSEIGQLSGIPKTDWSWAPLFADIDNDGKKDLFITNGYRRDARNKDFRIEMDKRENEGKLFENSKDGVEEALSLIPVNKMRNYLYHNEGNFEFSNKSNEFGISQPTFSNGAAYADLDNDGDLDLVINNILDPAFIYRNNSNDHHYLRVRLEGNAGNPTGIGAEITISNEAGKQFQLVNPTRGYLSGVEDIAHFGLGNNIGKASVSVKWPDGKVSAIESIEIDQTLVVKQVEAKAGADAPPDPVPMFTEMAEDLGIDFKHQENDYNDYINEVLLPHKMSQFGPALAVGDANGDGVEDFYVGGAHLQAGALHIQQPDGKFALSPGPWTEDAGSEDLGATFFDADGDQDLDLYVVSGGNEFTAESKKDFLLQDRLYLNEGEGNWSRARLPRAKTSGSVVRPYDYDGDGDLDLFVGGRVVPGKYPFAANSYLLKNDAGKWRNVTGKDAPALVAPGLVTDAIWTDFDGDGLKDLIVTGEWMNIMFLKNKNGVLEDVSETSGIQDKTGWWFSLAEADIDNDGDMDYLAGNLGLNYKYQGTEKEPFHIYAHDFDENGTVDIVLGYYNQGSCFPVRGRQCSSQQMPMIKKKYESYDDYGKATLNDVYGDNLKEALHYQANWFNSSVIENLGNGQFKITALPKEAQFSSVNAIIPRDFTGDGNIDLLIGGNLWVSEVETGRADASHGLLLEGDGKGGFSPLSTLKTGFWANFDLKDMQLIKGAKGETYVIAVNNNDRIQFFQIKSPSSNLSLLNP